jgi:hypothetical protein
MYNVNNQREYEEKCIASERVLCATFEIGGHIYDDKYINKMSFTHDIGTNGYKVGIAPAAILKVELNNFDGGLDNASLQDNDIRIFIGVEMEAETDNTDAVFEMVPMGTFFISEVKKSENRIEITAYDRMILLERKADIVLELPFELNDLLAEVELKGNITVDSSSYLPLGDIIVNKEINWKAYTYREIISYIAEVNGVNAFFTKNDTLKFVNLNVGDDGIAVIDKNSYFSLDIDTMEIFEGYDALIVGFSEEDDFDNSDEYSKYIYIIKDNPLTDFMIEENSEERYEKVEELATILSHTQYIPYSMEWRGIPSYELTDNIMFENMILRILNISWEYNGGFKMNCSAPMASKTVNDCDNVKSPVSITQQMNNSDRKIEKVTEKITSIENGTDETFNTTLVEVTKENVVAADMIEATSAFIEDLFVDRLETNLKSIKCTPNIQKNASGRYVWTGGYTIPYVANNIRPYIKIEGISLKFIEAHLTASGTRDLKINNKQVYYTSIGDAENAYKFFTFTDPKSKYPDLTDEEAAMFKVVVRSSENEYEKAEFKFEFVSSGGTSTYEPKLIIGTGDALGNGKLIYEKALNEAKIYINSRTENGESKGVSIKDDGLYQIRGNERSKLPFMTVDTTAPSNPRNGDLWFEPITQQGGE